MTFWSNDLVRLMRRLVAACEAWSAWSPGSLPGRMMRRIIVYLKPNAKFKQK